MVDALKIWEMLKNKVGTTAFNFYATKLGKSELIGKVLNDRIAGNEIGQSILQHGATNFDKEHFPGDLEEKEFYKTDLYIWQYMDMHIKQNIAIFQQYLQDYLNFSGNILFIDFGCGPITSGLAFAQVASQKFDDYKDRVHYLGIDISSNMVKSAQYINEKHNIFSQNNFQVIQNNTLQIDSKYFSMPFQAAIISMSFVLAPNTNKIEESRQRVWSEELAQQWNQLTNQIPSLTGTLAVYMNPNNSNLHENWDIFQQKIMNIPNGFSYKNKPKEEIYVRALGRSVVASYVAGERK